MYTHLAQLRERIPTILDGLTLDLGCGKGKLLEAIAMAGGRVIGLEYNPIYIELAQARLAAAGLSVEIVQGSAEAMPFAADCFDTINMSELIEHVSDPERVLSEVWRVLKPGGQAYLSVPNRYGAYDPHFHLWGINWLPRSVVEWVLTLLRRHKDYSPVAGHQRLTEMHYYRYQDIIRLLQRTGFVVTDIRLVKLGKIIKNPTAFQIAAWLYRLARRYYFNTFHFLIAKPVAPISHDH